jgi:hypothetical protein
MFVPSQFCCVLKLLCFCAHNGTSAVFLICMSRTGIHCDLFPPVTPPSRPTLPSPNPCQLYSPENANCIGSKPLCPCIICNLYSAQLNAAGAHIFKYVADRIFLEKSIVVHSVRTFRYCSSPCQQQPAKTKKTELHGLSPRANYTDRATAACRGSDCQLFADRGCHVVSVTDPYCRILCFLERSRNFSIK